MNRYAQDANKLESKKTYTLFVILIAHNAYMSTNQWYP